MRRRLPFVLLGIAVLGIGIGVGVLVGGDSDDDSADRPSGIIAREVARKIPLDTTRPQVVKRIGQKPVKVERQDVPRRTVPVAEMNPRKARNFRRKYGSRFTVNGDTGSIVFPAETYTCLLYRGHKPRAFAWRFCFGEKGTLQSVSTSPPLPVETAS
jgi:hypothetical protein